MDAIFSIFEFIYSIFDTIISGLRGTVNIVLSIVNLIISISKIIPNPLYGALVVFLGLYGIIFTYKIFRKG